MSKEQSTAERKRRESQAIWFFVAAVFVAVSPTLGAALNVSIQPVFSWSVAALLTILGFWGMFKRD